MKQRINFEDIRKRLETPSDKITPMMLSEIFNILFNLNVNEIENIKSSLANYVVIRLVSSVENFFKNKVRELIDKEGFDTDDIFPNNEITITLSDLDEIKKEEKFTKGRIVTYSINFQSLDQIDYIISKLLNLKGFRNEVKKHPHTVTWTDNKMTIIFDLGEIHALFELRHKIVHEMYLIPTSEYLKLWRYLAQTLMFLNISKDIIENAIKLRQKTQKQEKL